jgi:protein-disulfide isomerase
MSHHDRATLTLPVGSRDHSEGPANAAVTLVEYGDYECSHCGLAYPIVKEVRRRLGRRLRFVFRNFPLSQSHPHAQHAAEAAAARRR